MAGLKVMGPPYDDYSMAVVPMRYPIARKLPPLNPPSKSKSPRVKPAQHFSRVVANILSARPCEQPLPAENIYADDMTLKVFKNTLHGDKEFKSYIVSKYGKMFKRQELFTTVHNIHLDDLRGGTGGENEDQESCGDVKGHCVKNQHCWIPRYTKSYIENLDDYGCGQCDEWHMVKNLKTLRVGNRTEGGGNEAGYIEKDATYYDPYGTQAHENRVRNLTELKKGQGQQKDKNKRSQAGEIQMDEFGTPLYEWVKGPDGKVFRRPMTKYHLTEPKQGQGQQKDKNKRGQAGEIQMDEFGKPLYEWVKGPDGKVFRKPATKYHLTEPKQGQGQQKDKNKRGKAGEIQMDEFGKPLYEWVKGPDGKVFRRPVTKFPLTELKKGQGQQKDKNKRGQAGEIQMDEFGKPLYEWVKGPDGKVFRRPVTKYPLTELKKGQGQQKDKNERGQAGKIRKDEFGKPLYEWVKGPDGKVFRRPVAKYQDLGRSNMDAIGPRSRGKLKGKGNKSQRSRASSDTKLGKGGYGTGRGGIKEQKKKPKRNQGAYKIDAISLDVSGDSGDDDYRARRGKGRIKGQRKANKLTLPDKSRKIQNESGLSRPNQTKGQSPGGRNQRRIQNPKFGAPTYESGRFSGHPSQGRGLGKGRAPVATRNNLQAQRSKQQQGQRPRSHLNANDALRQRMNRRDRGGRYYNSSYRGGGNYRQDYGYRQGRRQGQRQDQGYGYRQGRRQGQRQGQGYGYKQGHHQGQRQGQGHDMGRKMFHRNKEWGGEDYSSSYEDEDDEDYFHYMESGYNEWRKDNEELLSLNQCWENASKIFKKPSKGLVNPPPENLMLYLESKHPIHKWPKGAVVGTRNYPNGSTFVAQHENGGSKVFYPHGGLAMVISAASPLTSQILVLRDPSDETFFFDKALLADLNSSGKGVIYGDQGVVRLQYNQMGGFKFDGFEKGRRWFWNEGGQRMVLKLNKFLSLRISDMDKIFLSYHGNTRGFLVNVASGYDITLMSPERTMVNPILYELKNLIRPNTATKKFDYDRGRFDFRATGLFDKPKHFFSEDNAASSYNAYFNNWNGLNNPYGYAELKSPEFQPGDYLLRKSLNEINTPRTMSNNRKILDQSLLGNNYSGDGGDDTYNTNIASASARFDGGAGDGGNNENGNRARGYFNTSSGSINNYLNNNNNNFNNENRSNSIRFSNCANPLTFFSQPTACTNGIKALLRCDDAALANCCFQRPPLATVYF